MPIRVPSGFNLLDICLDGGFPRAAITLIYGERGVGKTTLALQACIKCIELGGKAIFVDSSRGLTHRKIERLSGGKRTYLENILILRPTSFKSQNRILLNLDNLITENIWLVVVDEMTEYYTMELSLDVRKNVMLNRMLGRQVAGLLGLAKKRNFAVIITSDVRMKPNEGELPIAPQVLLHWSEIIIRLGKRKNALRSFEVSFKNRHRKKIVGTLTDRGFE